MRILAENKRATFDYEMLEKIEAGIVLTGPEVKSAKTGRINITSGYVVVDQTQTPWLINTDIAPYPPAKGVQQNYNPKQSRKLLLSKKEISRFIGFSQTKGLTIIPIRVYTKNGYIKVEIGVGRGKKKFEKKEQLKQKEVNRKVREDLKYTHF